MESFPLVPESSGAQKPIHPLIRELSRDLHATSYPEVHFVNLDVAKDLKFTICCSQQSPYFILLSNGPANYALFIPCHFSHLGLSPGGLWSTVVVIYDQGNSCQLCLPLATNVQRELRAEIPSQLEDFFEFVVKKQLIFLPFAQVLDLQHRQILTSRNVNLLTLANSRDGRRVYEVDLHQPTLVVSLFHHFKEVSSLLSLESRRKSRRHLRTFFKHSDLTVHSFQLEASIYKRSNRDPILYATIFMSVLKDTVNKLRSTIKSHIAKRSPEVHMTIDEIISLGNGSNAVHLSEKLNSFLAGDHSIANCHLVCPMCYKVKTSRGSLIEHLMEVEYKEELSSMVQSFWSPDSMQCNQRQCDQKASTEEAMMHHLGVDHALVLDIFVRNSEEELKPCFISGCSFMTLGLESLLHHMVFTHYIKELLQEIITIQTIHQLSSNQCPVLSCQNFFMKETLLRHYYLEHGAWMHFIGKPSANEVKSLADYYEMNLYGHIRTGFIDKFTCDLSPCLGRPVFTNYLTYLIHLARVHYSKILRNKPGYFITGKCSFDDCHFNTPKPEFMFLHLAVYHKAIISVDILRRKLAMNRYNVKLFKMYDGIWKIEETPIYCLGVHSYRSVSSLYISILRMNFGACSNVTCIPCGINLSIQSSQTKGKFLHELIYHTISREHINNYYRLSHEESNSKVVPLSKANEEKKSCLICGVEPDIDHHLIMGHQIRLVMFSKYIQFCSIRGIHPLKCELADIQTYIKFAQNINENINPSKSLEIISRFHEKGKELRSSGVIQSQLRSSTSGDQKLYTCMLCIYFATSITDMKEHFCSTSHRDKSLLKSKSCKNNKFRVSVIMRCEACCLYFQVNNYALDIHRHSNLHINYEFNLRFESFKIPVRTTVCKRWLYNCSICNLNFDSVKSAIPHASSALHMEIQELADDFYAFCHNLRANPATCEDSILQRFICNDKYKFQRRKVIKILQRIHSGMNQGGK